jgi:hypothetical protein
MQTNSEFIVEQEYNLKSFNQDCFQPICAIFISCDGSVYKFKYHEEYIDGEIYDDYLVLELLKMGENFYYNSYSDGYVRISVSPIIYAKGAKR